MALTRKAKLVNTAQVTCNLLPQLMIEQPCCTAMKTSIVAQTMDYPAKVSSAHNIMMRSTRLITAWRGRLLKGSVVGFVFANASSIASIILLER